MKAAEYVVHGVRSEEELAAANDLMATTQAPPYTECVRWLESTGPRWPGFKRAHTRVLYIDSEMAGALRIQPLKLRIGRARLTVGGIGWVSTKETCRNRGVCGVLMHDAVDFMTRSRFHASLLFGIPNLYQKFGFVTVLPEYTITIDVTERPPATPCVAPVSWADARTLRRLHEKHETLVSSSVVRNARYFEMLFRCTSRTIRFHPDWAAAVNVISANRRIVGYLMPQIDSDLLHIKELAVEGPEHFDLLLDAAFALARQRERGRVRFHLPPSHPFSAYLKDYSCVHETRTFRNAEGMMKLLHVAETLHEMIPEWEARLCDSGVLPKHTELVLAIDEKRFLISHQRGSVKVAQTDKGPQIRLTSQLLCRLLAGFTSASDLDKARLRLADEQRRFLACLFPARTPFIWPIDHF